MENSKSIIKPLSFALISALTVLAAQISGNSIFILGSLGLYISCVLFLKKDYLIPVMLFFLPWSTLLKLSPESTAFSSLVTLMVLLMMVGKNVVINTKLFFCVLGMILVTIISKFIHGYSFAPSYIMFFSMIVCFPLIYDSCREKVNFEHCAIFYSIGIISATVLALMFYDNRNILEYIVVTKDPTEIVRFCGFYGDPNFFAAQIVPAIGAMFLIIYKNKSRVLFNIILLVALFFCGFTAVSKSFLLCTLLVITLWVLTLFKEKPSKIFGVLIFMLVIIIALFASGALDDIIFQYSTRFNTVTNADSLTTGRSELWTEYLDFMFNNLTELFWGQGYTNVLNGVHKGSHNTLIQILYQFGLIGGVFVIGWFSTFKRNKKCNSFIPLLFWFVACFSMWFGLDMLFFDDFFFIIVLYFIGYNYYNERGVI